MQYVSLIVTTVESEDDYEAFVGDSTRTTQEYPVHCLYKRELSLNERSKYGVSKDTDMVVWIPPKEVQQYADISGGSFKIDEMKTKIRFNDIDYTSGQVLLIDKKIYKSPAYGTCFCIELHLKTLKSQTT
jgi:hypothetical protein